MKFFLSHCSKFSFLLNEAEDRAIVGSRLEPMFVAVERSLAQRLCELVANTVANLRRRLGHSLPRIRDGRRRRLGAR